MGTGYCNCGFNSSKKEENWPQVITGMGPTSHEPILGVKSPKQVAQRDVQKELALELEGGGGMIHVWQLILWGKVGTVRLFNVYFPSEKKVCNLQTTHLKRNIIFQTAFFSFHVDFPGCIALNKDYSTGRWSLCWLYVFFGGRWYLFFFNCFWGK